VKTLLAVLLVCTSAAYGDIIIAEGNVGGFDDSNVLFNDPTLAVTTGDPVIGFINGTSTLVHFESTGDDLIAPSGGQARVEANAGLFADVSFFSPTHNFGTAIFNVIVADAPAPGQTTGQIMISVENNLGQTETATLDVSSAGQNFFNITVVDPQRIQRISLSSTNVEFQSLQQVRLGDAQLNDGFDGDVDGRIARRGAPGHVKRGKHSNCERQQP
jgi:hypothetical protein